MNREQFEEWFCANGSKKCRKSSATTQYYNVRRLRRLLGHSEKIPKGHTWLPADPTKVFDNPSATVQRNLATTAVSFMRRLKNVPEKKLNRYIDFMMKFSQKVDKIYQSGEKTKKQKENWISMKQVRQFALEKYKLAADRGIWKKETWTPAERQMAQAALVLALHSESPPRLEMSSLVYTENPKEEPQDRNFIYRKARKGWYAMVGSGKTVKNEPFHIKLSRNAAKVLNKMRRHLRVGDPVFVTKKDTRMTRSAYGKWIIRMFKARFDKHVTASMLRTIYISEKYKDTAKWSEIVEDANKMMHSAVTALSKYKKEL